MGHKPPADRPHSLSQDFVKAGRGLGAYTVSVPSRRGSVETDGSAPLSSPLGVS
jgi:hypothetical protein